MEKWERRKTLKKKGDKGEEEAGSKGLKLKSMRRGEVKNMKWIIEYEEYETKLILVQRKEENVRSKEVMEEAREIRNGWKAKDKESGQRKRWREERSWKSWERMWKVLKAWKERYGKRRIILKIQMMVARGGNRRKKKWKEIHEKIYGEEKKNV